MKFIKQHRQEIVAALLIVIFWAGVGIKNELEYTPLSSTQFNQMIQEDSTQSVSPGAVASPVATPSPVQ